MVHPPESAADQDVAPPGHYLVWPRPAFPEARRSKSRSRRGERDPRDPEPRSEGRLPGLEESEDESSPIQDGVGRGNPVSDQELRLSSPFYSDATSRDAAEPEVPSVDPAELEPTSTAEYLRSPQPPSAPLGRGSGPPPLGAAPPSEF